MIVKLNNFIAIQEVSLPHVACITLYGRKMSQGSYFTKTISWQELESLLEVVAESPGERTDAGIRLSNDVFMYWTCQIEFTEPELLTM